MCLEESKPNWPIVITLKDKYGKGYFSEAINDEDMQRFKPKKWKPLHYMIYYDRINMMNDLIHYAGRWVKRALTIDNKKKDQSDESIALKLSITLKNHLAFHSIWRIANQWSLKHLNTVLKELDSSDDYCESIFKILLKSHTTRDILLFAPSEIREDALKKIQKLIKSYGNDQQKLESFLSKLQKGKQ